MYSRKKLRESPCSPAGSVPIPMYGGRSLGGNQCKQDLLLSVGKKKVLFKLARNMFLYVKYVIDTGCCGKVYCRVQSWQGAVPKCKILTVPSALGRSSGGDACTLSRMLEASGLGEQGLAWEGWMQDHRGKLARHPSGGVLGLGVSCQTGRAFSWWDAGHLCTASSWWDVEAGRDMPAI